MRDDTRWSEPDAKPRWILAPGWIGATASGEDQRDTNGQHSSREAKPRAPVTAAKLPLAAPGAAVGVAIPLVRTLAVGQVDEPGAALAFEVERPGA